MGHPVKISLLRDIASGTTPTTRRRSSVLTIPSSSALHEEIEIPLWEVFDLALPESQEQ